MRQGNGYLLRFQVEEMENLDATTVTLAAKGDIYYVAVGDDECFYDASASDHMDYYEKRNAEAEWEKHTMPYSTYYTREQAIDNMKAYIEANSVWMSYYDVFDTSLAEATKTSASLLGRSCDKYTFTAAALTGQGLNMVTARYECYVDKQTSICLKWHYEAIADGESASWSMECTEFNTNPNLTLPQVSGGEQGGEQGGGQQGGGNENADTYTVQMASREDIRDAFGRVFKVVANSNGDAVAVSASDGTYHLSTAPSARFSKQVGDNKYLPYTDLREGKYHRMGTPNYYPEEALGSVLGQGTVGLMFQFAGEILTYNTVEAINFLGRPAHKYVYESDNAYGYNVFFHEEVTIDDETGACLKYDQQARAGAGFTGGTRNKTVFEVTEIQYGEGNQAALDCIGEYIDMIDVYAWDEDFMTQAGLEPFNGLDEADLFESYWDYGSTRSSEEPYWEAQYNLHCNDASEYTDMLISFLREFYLNGANLDEDGQEVDLEELIWFDDELPGGFTGFTEGYEICVYTEYIGSSSTPYWRVTIDISLKAEY
ncbi:MAG: hypothetical protein J5755_03530, partial [Clostridia bacterium]|nr:hypothetical protein [Clostridia bacterium]